MPVLNDGVLNDPERLAAVDAARRDLAAAPLPMNAISRLAARLVDAPMATITLVDNLAEHFAGSHDLPRSLTDGGQAPLSFSVCKYIVSHDQPVHSGDLLAEESPDLREHPLAERFGVRAFAGVPVRAGTDRPVGSLTVFDTAAREWTPEHLRILTEIAELVRPAEAGPERHEIAGLDSAALLDSVQEAFLAVEPNGTVVGFNHAAQRMLGYPADQVCGRHLDESLLPGYDGQPIDVALARLFDAAPRRPVLRELTMRHQDGRRLPVRAALSVVRGEQGALACIFLTDLSEQAAAEQLADRHSSFLTALLESLSVGVAACDETGRLVLLNEALRQVRDWPAGHELPADYPETLNGMLRYPDLRVMAWEETPLMRAFRGEHVVDADVLVAVPGRRTRRFATTAQPIVGAGGSRLGAVAVGHEVTALRRAEQFRECHQQIEHAFRTSESAADAAPEVLRAVTTALSWPCAELFLIDDSTGGLRSVGHYDTAGAGDDGFFGHIPVRGEAVTGRVWHTGQHLWVADIAEMLDRPTPYEAERVRIFLSRGIRTVLAVPVRDGGTMLGVLTCYAGNPEFHEDLLTVLLEGVAAQIGVYVALRRAEQYARQLSRSQDDFIDLVGHEMRTPLMSIAANAGLLAEDAGALDPDHRNMIEVIGRNTAVLQQIVDTLLDLAGLDSGHVTLTVQSVDLAQVIREAVTAAWRPDGPSIDTRLPERLIIDGDRNRLRQVVDDLLANAATYSPADGHIEVSLQIRDDAAELHIADTGIGIPPTEHGRVLDRFFRGSNVRHHGIPGSGLGLSLAHAIVRRHHGTITLEDNQPTGTVVRVCLPQNAES